MALFAFEHLTFRYPEASRDALADVDLTVEAGQFMLIVGPSGCGKTTLMRHCKPALEPHGRRAGRVLFDGKPFGEVPRRDQVARIGFVMQDPDTQIVTDKVWHELAFVLESLGCDQRTMRLRVAEMASFFGIQHWFRKDVGGLSGGQKQLLNLASAMAAHPDVLVLDEPTSQLDPIAARDFIATVSKINRELGTTVVMSEHRLEEAYSLADQVVVMEEGRITAHGAPRAVADALHRTADPMARALPAAARIAWGAREGLGAKEGRSGASGCHSPGENQCLSGDPPPAAAVAAEKDADDAQAPLGRKVPLTVREGRAWLAGETAIRPPSQRSLPDQEPLTEDPAQAALRLKDLWLRYERDGDDVLRGTTLTVPTGSLFAIAGGNGTGKSTLLRAICGVVRPYRGKIEILGRRLKDWKSGDLFHGGVALLPQDPQNLMVKKTVRADLEEMLEGRGLGSTERSRSIESVAARTEIEPLLSMHPRDLSGGELQRAALAKVLLAEPRLLLLDEPTKGLDAFYKEKLADLLGKLTAHGKTVLLVSHDVEFCANAADLCALFFDGDVVAVDEPRRFFSSNLFYTTAASRISRGTFANAVTVDEVVSLCRA